MMMRRGSMIEAFASQAETEEDSPRDMEADAIQQKTTVDGGDVITEQPARASETVRKAPADPVDAAAVDNEAFDHLRTTYPTDLPPLPDIDRDAQIPVSIGEGEDYETALSRPYRDYDLRAYVKDIKMTSMKRLAESYDDVRKAGKQPPEMLEFISTEGDDLARQVIVDRGSTDPLFLASRHFLLTEGKDGRTARVSDAIVMALMRTMKEEPAHSILAKARHEIETIQSRFARMTSSTNEEEQALRDQEAAALKPIRDKMQSIESVTASLEDLTRFAVAIRDAVKNNNGQVPESMAKTVRLKEGDFLGFESENFKHIHKTLREAFDFRGSYGELNEMALAIAFVIDKVELATVTPDGTGKGFKAEFDGREGAIWDTRFNNAMKLYFTETDRGEKFNPVPVMVNPSVSTAHNPAAQEGGAASAEPTPVRTPLPDIPDHLDESVRVELEMAAKVFDAASDAIRKRYRELVASKTGADIQFNPATGKPYDANDLTDPNHPNNPAVQAKPQTSGKGNEQRQAAPGLLSRMVGGIFSLPSNVARSIRQNRTRKELSAAQTQARMEAMAIEQTRASTLKAILAARTLEHSVRDINAKVEASPAGQAYLKSLSVAAMSRHQADTPETRGKVQNDINDKSAVASDANLQNCLNLAQLASAEVQDELRQLEVNRSNFVASSMDLAANLDKLGVNGTDVPGLDALAPKLMASIEKNPHLSTTATADLKKQVDEQNKGMMEKLQAFFMKMAERLTAMVSGRGSVVP